MQQALPSSRECLMPRQTNAHTFLTSCPYLLAPYKDSHDKLFPRGRTNSSAFITQSCLAPEPETVVPSSSCHTPIGGTSTGSDYDSNRERPSGSQDWRTPSTAPAGCVPAPRPR